MTIGGNHQNERTLLNIRCGTCGAVFALGEQHTCSTYRPVFSGNTEPPPKRIQVNGHWYILEEQHYFQAEEGDKQEGNPEKGSREQMPFK